MNSFSRKAIEKMSLKFFRHFEDIILIKTFKKTRFINCKNSRTIWTRLGDKRYHWKMVDHDWSRAPSLKKTHTCWPIIRKFWLKVKIWSNNVIFHEVSKVEGFFTSNMFVSMIRCSKHFGWDMFSSGQTHVIISFELTEKNFEVLTFSLFCYFH